MTIINAFHPLFMKTYYPDFMKEFRTIQAKKDAATASKVESPSKLTAAHLHRPNAKSKAKKKPVTMQEVKQGLDDFLKRTEFHIYAKAVPSKK